MQHELISPSHTSLLQRQPGPLVSKFSLFLSPYQYWRGCQHPHLPPLWCLAAGTLATAEAFPSMWEIRRAPRAGARSTACLDQAQPPFLASPPPNAHMRLPERNDRTRLRPAWPQAVGQGCRTGSLPRSVFLSVPSGVASANGSGGRCQQNCPVLEAIWESLPPCPLALLLAAYRLVL